MLRIAVVGIGRQGKKLINEFSKLSTIKYCCSNGNKENINWLNKNFPSIEHIRNYEDVLMDDSIDCVIVATPINTHSELVKKALKNGKHVFVEKPLSDNSVKSKELVNLATSKHKKLMVGYTFLYHEIFNKIKEIIKIEDIEYIQFDWNKLGSFKEDIVRNLVSHDLGILIKLIGIPDAIDVINKKGLISKGDIISLQVRYFKKINCLINVNRLSLRKNKKMTILSKKNVFIWDDNSLFILDKDNNFKLLHREKKQALTNECEKFIEAVEKNKEIYSDGKFALVVDEVLENKIKNNVIY